MKNIHTNFHLHFESSWSKQGFINQIKTVGHTCTKRHTTLVHYPPPHPPTVTHAHYTTLSTSSSNSAESDIRTRTTQLHSSRRHPTQDITQNWPWWAYTLRSKINQLLSIDSALHMCIRSVRQLSQCSSEPLRYHSAQKHENDCHTDRRSALLSVRRKPIFSNKKMALVLLSYF